MIVGFENGDIRFRSEIGFLEGYDEIDYLCNRRYYPGYRVEQKQRNYCSEIFENGKYPDNSEYARA